jgi:hypothetical protein
MPQVNMRIDADALELLDLFCEAHGYSRRDLIMHAIGDHIDVCGACRRIFTAKEESLVE